MVKPNTINLNSVRLNTVALNHYGNISGGGSKPDPIAAWIRKHMAFRYDAKGYTNEVLSQTKQLEDLSGNNRPMLLNNFLFDMMSGMGGYKNHRFNQNPGINFYTVLDRQCKGKPSSAENKFGYYYILNNNGFVLYIDWYIEGIKEDNKVYVKQFISEYDLRVELHNGINHIEFDIADSPNSNYKYITVVADQPYSTDITITQIPEYPGALVTDGVDDYGVVQNMAHGVKMLFMTVNPIGDFNVSKIYYSQRKDIIKQEPFTVFTGGGGLAYAGNPGGVTYINGLLNESIKPDKLFGVKHIITTVNDNTNSETSRTPCFFGEIGNPYFSKLSFYNSIGFDSIPTEEDGFTKQELIDYVIEKYE